VKSILNQYHKRINGLEGEKYDLEYEVAKKDLEVEKVFSWQTKERDAAINANTNLPLFLFVFSFFFLCLFFPRAKHISLYLATVPICITCKLSVIIIRRRRVEAELFT
jgi:hypothetical protein